MKRYLLASLVLATLGCGADRRFAARDPFSVDTDLRSVSVPCRKDPTEKDKAHVSCAPREYVSPIIWDGADNLVFRPFAELWALKPSREAMNVNSLDEVPDSSWFTNRTGPHALAPDELTRGACKPAQILDWQHAPDGSWLVDHGKTDGSSPGFRVTVNGKKYLLKADDDPPERPSAASVVGAAVYNATGFNTSCEQVVYVKRSVFKLKPGLMFKGNFDAPRPFDQTALDAILKKAAPKGDLLRFQASAWIDGKLLGPFRYAGTRKDDPNDIIPHEERRELRGGRILAAWIDHFDAREQNSMDAWIADGHGAPDASPGKVIHYYLDTSDAFGPDFGPILTPRMGFSYTLDWSDMAEDLLTLGVLRRPWFAGAGDPGFSVFRGFDVHSFVPSEWKMQYENPAFSRMTERDGAWMARILARFSREQVRALAQMAELTDPKNTEHLETVLEGRLERILARYLTRLAPIGELHVEARDRLCGLDLAQMRAVREPASFRFTARWSPGAASPDDGRRARGLRVEASGAGRVCVDLPRVAPDAGPRDDSPQRYVTVHVDDGVAQGPLVAYLYDLGPARGYVLAGIDRPEG